MGNLCLRFFLEFANLSSKFFTSQWLFAHFYYACNPNFGSLAIFSLKISKILASLYFLIKTKFPIIYKKLYKNRTTCLMAREFHVFNVSVIKYRVRYRQNCLFSWNLITFWKLSSGRKHLWVCMISSFKFHIFKSNLSFLIV